MKQGKFNPVKVKFILVFIMCIFMLCLGFYGIYNLKKMKQDTKALYANRMLPVNQLSIIRFSYINNILLPAQYLNNQKLNFNQGKQQIENAQQIIKNQWEAYLQTYISPEEKKLADQAWVLMQQADLAIEKLKSSLEHGDSRALSKIINTDLLKLNRCVDKIYDLVLFQVTAGKEAAENSYNSYDTTSKEIFIILILVLAFSFLFIYLIFRNVEKKNGMKLKSLLDEAPDAFFHADIHGDIFEVNEQAVVLTGYSREELLNMDWKDFYSYEELSKTPIKYDLVSGGNSVITERMLTRKDGTLIPVEVKPKKTSETTFQCFMSDISERKNTELALKLSEEKFRLLFDKSPDIIIITNEKGEFVDCNETAFKVFGIKTKEELKELNAINHYELNTSRSDILDELKTKGFINNKEINFLLPNGNKLNALLSVATLKFSGENQIIISWSRDITQIKLAEKELKESKEQLQLITDNVPVLITLIDTEFNILFANVANNLFFNKTAIKGLKLVDLIGKDAFEQSLPNLIKAFTGREIKFENRIITYNNEEKILLMRFIPNFENDEIKGLFIFSQDITAQKLYEEKLKSAQEQADNANRLKSEFLANMSHEIRTPLNAMLGFTEILSETLKADDTAADYLKGIKKSGNNLILLINDILDLAKIEAGRLNIVYAPADIGEIMYDVKQVFSGQIKEKKLSYEINIEKDLPPYILIDQLRLRQILFNLIGNAIKFTNNGGIIINIKRSTPSMKDSIVNLKIEIIDTGIGISPENLESIFEPFVQQQGQSPQFGGTGLGLSICKRLLEIMNGTLTVESRIGQGSKFKIELNNLKIANTLPQQRMSNDKPQNINFKNSNILLVEDNEANRKVILGYLKYFNLNILEAVNGEEAISMMESNKIDLILMDIRMPVIDGKQASKFLKSNEKFKHIPIIVLTASALLDEEEVLKTLIEGYLRKPVSKDDLIVELTKFLPFTNEPIVEIDRPPFVNENFEQLILEFLKQYVHIDAFKKEFLEWYDSGKNNREFLNLNGLKVDFTKLLKISLRHKVKPLEEYCLAALHAVNTFAINDITSFVKTLDSINSFKSKKNEA